MAGVTGTNGKTTTAFLLKHICEKRRPAQRLDRNRPLRNRGSRFTGRPHHAGVARPAGVARANGERRLQSGGDGSLLARPRAGTDARPAMGRRHLHQPHPGPSRFSRTMEDYFEAKAQPLHRPNESDRQDVPTAVINLDDRHGEQLVKRLGDTLPVLTYGLARGRIFALRIIVRNSAARRSSSTRAAELSRPAPAHRALQRLERARRARRRHIVRR